MVLKVRGTGRTSKQMLEAPIGATFVWCNHHLEYPRLLATSLGRNDLRIIPPPRDDNQLRGVASVVYDHAGDL